MSDMNKYPLPGQPHPHRGHPQVNAGETMRWGNGINAPTTPPPAGITVNHQGNAPQPTPNRSLAHTHNGMVHHTATHHTAPSHHTGGHHGGRKKK